MSIIIGQTKNTFPTMFLACHSGLEPLPACSRENTALIGGVDGLLPDRHIDRLSPWLARMLADRVQEKSTLGVDNR
jgi:hypothetical protein